MKVAVLGTGRVGLTLATKLSEVGHEVMMGSRTADKPEGVAWAEGAGDGARMGTFADAAAFAELVINATSGGGALDALGSCGDGSLDGKVLIDVSNPLDFSQGFPPSLSVHNTDSLGEQIQAAHPAARVVKTFNTMGAHIMVQPSLVPGHHTVFHSGNDASAKAEVAQLQQSFGWPAEDILDLGDITTSRGTEMYLPLWLRMFGALGVPNFNIHVVSG
jgi:predicted dinucleotide-binding enzyme